MKGFPGPDFWRERLRPKGEGENRRELTGQCWDKAAKTYDDLENEPDYAKLTQGVFEKMAQKGILTRDFSLIDIACGTGNYALVFAPYLKEITGVDISAGMLERFREKVKERGISNCKIIHQDWRSFEAKKEFDIVFSSMNPLLGYHKNIDQMLNLSKRFVVLIGWAGVRKNVFLEEISKKILGHPPQAPKSDITVVFGYLYSLGYAPEIQYFTGTWHRTYELSKQIERIIWRLEFERDLTAREREIVKDELMAISKNGMVTLETKVRIGMIFLDKDLN
ncbi:hypothetical protein DBT_1057 [Dissulfuribacter thermophilus]|uniref:Methyltransferase domain-containing protein n=1 Tax=Dissulfuribacter thermophilus TaxID=1156395 RepID=A0A1B9F710_9BACT|nr:class I SAM-dependent methyltransferase [Dissulfuribacter thermophilus]OCC15706.1 hypothetical protein DBT_1057 [Dissulfuribacter thermophilus]